jgi:hypothetical protein
MLENTNHLDSRAEKLRGKRIRKWKRAGFIISFLIVPVIQFLIFYVYINASSFPLAFQRKNPFLNTTEWVGWENFKKVIGPSVFWFEATFAEGKDLYISLDSATGTLGSKQTKWFRSFLSENRAKYRHCVILTHTNFFYTDNSQTGSGNMPFEESLALIDFLGKQNVSLALQGHDHSREDLMYDNVRYVILGAIHDKADAPEDLKIDVNNEGLTLNYKMIP